MTEKIVAGRYRLLRRLGSGGMAEVWAAEDLELERPVALKLLGPEADPARFEREARAAAALAHPNVTQLFD
jgi:eukaryotic-like serine/threonine-protein kinase